MVFLFPLAAHTAKYSPLAVVSNSPSNQIFSRYFVYFPTYLYPDRFTQQNQLHPSSAFLRRIFIRRTLRLLHQSVNLLSKPFHLHLFFQIYPFHLFCNNHTSKPIILIATCTMIYSFFMMSTRQNISNFRPLLNATQINAVISRPTAQNTISRVKYSAYLCKSAYICMYIQLHHRPSDLN